MIWGLIFSKTKLGITKIYASKTINITEGNDTVYIAV